MGLPPEETKRDMRGLVVPVIEPARARRATKHKGNVGLSTSGCSPVAGAEGGRNFKKDR